MNDYRVLASNLLTSNNYSVKLSAAALGLVQGQYVTDYPLRVRYGSQWILLGDQPTIKVQVKGTPDGYQIINRNDVGGRTSTSGRPQRSNWSPSCADSTGDSSAQDWMIVK